MPRNAGVPQPVRGFPHGSRVGNRADIDHWRRPDPRRQRLPLPAQRPSTVRAVSARKPDFRDECRLRDRAQWHGETHWRLGRRVPEQSMPLPNCRGPPRNPSQSPPRVGIPVRLSATLRKTPAARPARTAIVPCQADGGVAAPGKCSRQSFQGSLRGRIGAPILIHDGARLRTSFTVPGAPLAETPESGARGPRAGGVPRVGLRIGGASIHGELRLAAYLADAADVDARGAPTPRAGAPLVKTQEGGRARSGVEATTPNRTRKPAEGPGTFRCGAPAPCSSLTATAHRSRRKAERARRAELAASPWRRANRRRGKRSAPG